MSWWNLPDSNTEWMGDAAADAAADALEPLGTATPKPTADQVLDALEVVLRDIPPLSGAPLDNRTLEWRARPRRRGAARADLVALLRGALPAVAAVYHDAFRRAPTLLELLYALSFKLRGKPATYTSDAERLTSIVIIG